MKVILWIRKGIVRDVKSKIFLFFFFFKEKNNLHYFMQVIIIFENKHTVVER